MCSNCNYPGYFYRTLQETQYIPLSTGINCVIANYDNIYCINSKNIISKISKDLVIWTKYLDYKAECMELYNENIYIFSKNIITCLSTDGDLLHQIKFNFLTNIIKNLSYGLFISRVESNTITILNVSSSKIKKSASIKTNEFLIDFFIVEHQVYFLLKIFGGFRIISNNINFKFKANVENGAHFILLNNVLYWCYFLKGFLYISNFEEEYIIENVMRIVKIFNNEILLIEMNDGSLEELTKPNKANRNTKAIDSIKIYV